jgi:hypothetical protein
MQLSTRGRAAAKDAAAEQNLTPNRVLGFVHESIREEVWNVDCEDCEWAPSPIETFCIETFCIEHSASRLVSPRFARPSCIGRTARPGLQWVEVGEG